MFIEGYRAFHCYKYYKVTCEEKLLIIAVSCDDTYNKLLYGASTNICFYQVDDDTIAPCCGVGHDENSALNMCLYEINKIYKNKELSLYNKNVLLNMDLDGINLAVSEEFYPYKICLLDGQKNRVTFYYKKNKNGIEILTSSSLIKTNYHSINLAIKSNLEIILKGNNSFSELYLKNNGFYPIFSSTIDK